MGCPLYCALLLASAPASAMTAGMICPLAVLLFGVLLVYIGLLVAAAVVLAVFLLRRAFLFASFAHFSLLCPHLFLAQNRDPT
jgi:hypothetical protein